MDLDRAWRADEFLIGSLRDDWIIAISRERRRRRIEVNAHIRLPERV